MTNISVSHFIALKSNWSILKKIERIQEHLQTKFHIMATKRRLILHYH